LPETGEWRRMMAAGLTTRVFVSFDYDHDRDLKTMLVGQSRNEKSPFLVEDWSIKEESKTWRKDAASRITRSDIVIAICGLYTHQASGVAAEIAIAKDLKVRYALLRGRKEGRVRRPQGTSWWWDEMHPWTWKDLQSLTRIKR
jgi:hypothetical protein